MGNPIPTPIIKKLSPSALSWFEKDVEKFVLYYVFGEKRGKQNFAMAIGSAFDARIKGEIIADLLGQPNPWEEFFNKQVETEELRDFTRGRSAIILKDYKQCGAYSYLLDTIKNYEGTPRFEFDAAGIINVNGLDIPIAGKPDLHVCLGECQIVLDWKVNGFMSSASPAPGYASLRGLDGFDAGHHKNVMCMMKHGIMIAIGGAMKPEWQTQLVMYQWMIDAANEKPWIAWIEQLAYANNTLRVASHRICIDEEWEASVRDRVYRCWNAVSTGHYFWDVSREESDARMQEIADMDDFSRWILCEQGNKNF